MLYKLTLNKLLIYSLHAKFVKDENWNLVLRGSNFFHEIKCSENQILHQVTMPICQWYETLDDYYCTKNEAFSKRFL